MIIATRAAMRAWECETVQHCEDTAALMHGRRGCQRRMSGCAHNALSSLASAQPLLHCQTAAAASVREASVTLCSLLHTCGSMGMTSPMASALGMCIACALRRIDSSATAASAVPRSTSRHMRRLAATAPLAPLANRCVHRRGSGASATAAARLSGSVALWTVGRRCHQLLSGGTMADGSSMRGDACVLPDEYCDCLRARTTAAADAGRRRNTKAEAGAKASVLQHQQQQHTRTSTAAATPRCVAVITTSRLPLSLSSSGGAAQNRDCFAKQRTTGWCSNSSVLDICC